MDEYYYFDDEELYKDLTEQLAAAQAENAILQRCCEALQYAYTKKEKELQGLVGKETASEPNLHRNQFHTAIIQGNRAAGMTFILLFKI